MPCPNSARKRTISIAIRVSPEESDRIKLLCAATGKTQRELLEYAATNVRFAVEPDMRTFKALKDHMAKVYSELTRLRDAGGMDDRLIEKITLLSDLFIGMAPEGTVTQIEAKDDVIDTLSRL